MSERTTSRAEAADIRRVMMQAVDKLEDYGFDRSQIGSAMVGIGGGLVAAHLGVKQAVACLDGAKDAALASEPQS